ncbi:MAG TPA: transposase [Streptosporangiaceae bacterium]|nr:transposase [Streptosporangiaceae bacterium]
MKADAGRRYRLYPSSGQADRLTAWGHTCRAVWNTALEQRQFAWQQRHHAMRAAGQCAHLTQARADLPWLADLPAQSAQQVLRQLDHAYDNWWNPQHPAGAPGRKKRRASLAVPFTGQQVAVMKLNRHWGAVRLPKIGWVRFRMSCPLGGTLRNATVTVNGAGVWHVAFGVATSRKPAPPNGKPGCGVDFGVACSAYVSDEDTPRIMPPTLTPGEKQRLLGLERRKARQVTYAKKHNSGRYSRRLRNTIAAIAALKTRQARRRLDFTHKLTTDLAKNHGWVGIEDLRVKNMTASAMGTRESPGTNVRQKAGLNRAILDGVPHERRRQLEYKAPMFGSELRTVPAPGTSQECSRCHTVDPANRPGCGREFACTSCGYTGHADKNAALVIEGRARRAGGPNSTRRHPVPSRRETGRRMREPLAGAA